MARGRSDYSGRPVTLAVGEHVRLPHTYRGRDILWWMDASGLLDQRWDAVPDLVRARNLPSMQLVGARRTLDLNTLRRHGVALVGRLAGARDVALQFSGSLANVCALADLKLGRLRDTFEACADRAGIDAQARHRFAPTAVPPPVLSAQLAHGHLAGPLGGSGPSDPLPGRSREAGDPVIAPMTASLSTLQNADALR
jgi:putative flavoprotein involved in K+ transport